MTSTRMRWAGSAERFGEMISTCKVLIVKKEAKMINSAVHESRLNLDSYLSDQ
jgi:hypothetical protein